MKKEMFFNFHYFKEKCLIVLFLGVFSLFSFNVWSNANLVVSDIRAGTEIDKTRVSFEMSYPASLYVETRGEGVFLVSGPEDTYWRVPAKKQVEKGPLKSYEIVDLERGKGCLLRFDPYTKLMGSFGRKNTYIMDLETKQPPPPPPPPVEPAPEEKPLDLPPPAPVVPTVTLNQKVAMKSNEINSLSVLPKNDGSTWVIINSDKQEFFEYQLVETAREFHVYLPKINWPTLKTEVLRSGIITSYSVDETSDKMSSVRMQLHPEKKASVVDLFSAPNLDGTFDFVIILADRQATPNEVRRIAERRMHMKKNMQPFAESFEFKPPMAYYGEKVEGGPFPPQGMAAPATPAVPPPSTEEPLFDPIS